jgi:hypothetical protein
MGLYGLLRDSFTFLYVYGVRALQETLYGLLRG